MIAAVRDQKCPRRGQGNCPSLIDGRQRRDLISLYLTLYHPLLQGKDVLLAAVLWHKAWRFPVLIFRLRVCFSTNCSYTRCRKVTVFVNLNGAPGAIRTPGPQIRSLMLYPAELRVHGVGDLAGWAGVCKGENGMRAGKFWGGQVLYHGWLMWF